jgi:hypothetical protein
MMNSETLSLFLLFLSGFLVGLAFTLAAVGIWYHRHAEAAGALLLAARRACAQWQGMLVTRWGDRWDWGPFERAMDDLQTITEQEKSND